MDLGWWLGHVFELFGIALVGASVAYDLRRGRRSRPLVGDLRAAEIVASEEAFLGARVRALMVRLAEKDTSTEEHTRRVAALAVEVGEQLGLPPARLRSLAIGGLLHDMGKLSVPDAILQKPGPLDDDEFATDQAAIPSAAASCWTELGGFDETVKRLVLDHHERLDGQRVPARALAARPRSGDADPRASATFTTRSSHRASTGPRGRRTRRSAKLRDEAGTAFDPQCVDALVRILGHNVAAFPVKTATTRLAPTG